MSQAASTPGDEAHGHGHAGASLAGLTVGAIGVVYGDIGTSPLYTLRECLRETGGVASRPADVLGVLSLMFWSLTMVVTFKYLAFVMRASNNGEGGIFALLALVPERLRVRSGTTALSALSILVVVGAALLFGDGAITPAISVLSAIEGLALVKPTLAPAVVPITCVILLALFAMQRHGTAAVGTFFGPIMLVWFVTIGGVGAYHLAHNPAVLQALSPVWGARFFLHHGGHGFLILGSVVLCVTGGEALYADMGHFGARPIRIAWLAFVMPALVLCYFGQGALVLSAPERAENPFFMMVPDGLPRLLLVLLSSAATIIASQALISGAFSLTRQAMQLGFFPRVTVRHTAAHTEGQIYIPQINWILAVGCLLLVLGFHQSERLAAAYGIAVTGTMALTSIVFYVVARHTWGWSVAKAGSLLVSFLVFDLAFFGANTVKIIDGGWVPVVIGIGFVAAMLNWSKGRSLLFDEYQRRFGSVEETLDRVERTGIRRVTGTGVFMTSSTKHVPPVLAHLIERVGTLHENVILLTVETSALPIVPVKKRYEVVPLRAGFHRIVAHYGFMEEPDVPALVKEAAPIAIELDRITYFLGRESMLGKSTGAMGRIAEGLFGYLQRNAVRADRHFHIPPSQVIEVGIQLDL